jgi:hypothetical protein
LIRLPSIAARILRPRRRIFFAQIIVAAGSGQRWTNASSIRLSSRHSRHGKQRVLGHTHAVVGKRSLRMCRVSFLPLLTRDIFMHSQTRNAPIRDGRQHGKHLFSLCKRTLALLCALIIAPAALANGVGENAHWQFRTSADKSNQAMVQDMVQKRKNGYYAAPVVTTNIGRQFNCNVGATATGNGSANSAVANSPSNSGASAGSTGNQNSSGLDSMGGSASSTQGNSGSVSSGVRGNTTTDVNGSASQALNSAQTNGAAQTATVGSSNGCLFGALN